MVKTRRSQRTRCVEGGFARARAGADRYDWGRLAPRGARRTPRLGQEGSRRGGANAAGRGHILTASAESAELSNVEAGGRMHASRLHVN